MLSVRVWLRKSALMHALQQMMTAEFCLFIIRQEICRRGGAWFASFGRTRNTGTKVRTHLVTSCFTYSVSSTANCVCSYDILLRCKLMLATRM